MLRSLRALGTVISIAEKSALSVVLGRKKTARAAKQSIFAESVLFFV